MREQEKILVSAIDAAKLLSIGRSTFFMKVKAGLLPQPCRTIGRAKWRVSELQKIFETSATSTTKP